MDRKRFARGRDAFDRNRVQSSRLSFGERLGVRASHRISKESPSSPFIELSPLDLERWVKACRDADLSKPQVGEAPESKRDLNPSGWVGKAAIARHFGVSVRTIESWLVNGLPHARPSSRMVRFRISDCEEWYNQQYRMQSRPSAYRPRRIQSV